MANSQQLISEIASNITALSSALSQSQNARGGNLVHPAPQNIERFASVEEEVACAFSRQPAPARPCQSQSSHNCSSVTQGIGRGFL